MNRIGLIRMGDLAAMVSSDLYALQTYSLRPLLASLLASLALGVMTIVALEGKESPLFWHESDELSCALRLPTFPPID